VRANIPRPGEEFVTEHIERGRRTWRINRTWYRFLANLLDDTTATEGDQGTTSETQVFERLTRLEDAVSSLEVQPAFNVGALLAQVEIPDQTDHSWIPLVDGAEPAGFITDGAGVLITVPYYP
jgi:hypothetical protein